MNLALLGQVPPYCTGKVFNRVDLYNQFSRSILHLYDAAIPPATAHWALVWAIRVCVQFSVKSGQVYRRDGQTSVCLLLTNVFQSRADSLTRAVQSQSTPEPRSVISQFNLILFIWPLTHPAVTSLQLERPNIICPTKWNAKTGGGNRARRYFDPYSWRWKSPDSSYESTGRRRGILACYTSWNTI